MMIQNIHHYDSKYSHMTVGNKKQNKMCSQICPTTTHEECSFVKIIILEIGRILLNMGITNKGED